ncbi:retrovirus-related pol polyprotein from transposon TNT 1-94 [Tanacetum coccineum]
MNHHQNKHLLPDLMHQPNTKAKENARYNHYLHLSQAVEKMGDLEQRLKEIRKCQNKLGSHCKILFKKIYKPTNNNLKKLSKHQNQGTEPDCRQSQGVATGLARDSDEEIDKQNWEALSAIWQRCNGSCSKSELVYYPSRIMEKVDSNVIPNSSDMCDNDIQTDQNDVECDVECVALANLIANLTLDTEENKKILKQLKKANTSLTQELKECLIALQSKQIELETYKTLNDRIVDYDKLEWKLNETLGLLAQKEIDIKEGLKLKAYEISVVKEKHDELFVPDRKETLTLEKKSRSKLNKELVKPYDYTKQNSLYEFFKPASQEYHDQLAHANETQNDSFKFVHELKQEMHVDLKYIESLEKEIDELESDKAEFSNMYDLLLQECVSQDVMVNHRTNVSRPSLKSIQMKDKVVPNNSQVKSKKTEGNNLLTGIRGFDLYTISLQETTSSTLISFMAKASPTQAWLWHRRLSHLNFDYINMLSKKDIVIGLPKLKYVKDQLCSSCELSKEKKSKFKTKVVPSSKGWLNLLHMDLYGLMRVESINGKKYILVIVDDYSRYTWTLFLRFKDETPEVLKDFLKMIQHNLQAQVITVRTNRGTKFLNKTLTTYFKEEGI